MNEISTQTALDVLKNAMLTDYECAWSWHCNIVCCAMDEGVEHGTANRIAGRFMKLAFGVDTSRPPSLSEPHLISDSPRKPS